MRRLWSGSCGPGDGAIEAASGPAEGESACPGGATAEGIVGDDFVETWREAVADAAAAVGESNGLGGSAGTGAGSAGLSAVGEGGAKA